MSKVVITLSTVPERLSQKVEDGFKLCLKSLCEQNFESYEVHVNIPEIYKITNTPYIIPEWMDEYQTNYPHLKIFRPEDIGPPTKVLPTILREDKETLLIVVDDDLVYHPDMISEHVRYHKQLENSVILYDGRGLFPAKYKDLRDSWVLTVSEISRVKQLQHYKSASYYVRYFEQDFFNDFVGKTRSDDVLMSMYFRFKKIKMFVVPYEGDLPHIDTYEKWHAYHGVSTFPVLKHSNSVMKTGCNHPDMISQEPRFYLPEEFKQIERTPLEP